MVGMVPDVIVKKYDMSVGEGGGGKDKKVSVIGVLENKPETTKDNDGIDTLSMVVSTLGSTCSGVVGPFRS